jgi:hypothetical protein
MLFLIVIFLMYTFASLSVLMLAVNFYQETVKQAEYNENSRSASAYIREVMHQNDVSGGVSIGNFDGYECLMVEEDGGYILYIYLMDGSLRELYTREDAAVSAGNGQKIMKLEELSMEEAGDGIFKITFTDESGQSDTVIISEKSGSGGQV